MKRVNWTVDERVDKPDLDDVQELVAEHFRKLTDRLFGQEGIAFTGRPFVLAPFGIDDDGVLTLTVYRDKSLMVPPQSPDAQVWDRNGEYLTHDESAQEVDLTLPAVDDIYYVCVRSNLDQPAPDPNTPQTDPTDPKDRRFWDNGAATEVTQNVYTRNVPGWMAGFTTDDPDGMEVTIGGVTSGWFLVGMAQVVGGVIVVSKEGDATPVATPPRPTGSVRGFFEANDLPVATTDFETLLDLKTAYDAITTVLRVHAGETNWWETANCGTLAEVKDARASIVPATLASTLQHALARIKSFAITVGPTGTPDADYDNLPDAVAKFVALGGGGTIYLRRGTYTLAAKLTLSANVEIVGESRAETTIRPAAAGYPDFVLIEMVSGCTLRNVTLVPNGVAALDPYVSADGDNITVKDVTFASGAVGAAPVGVLLAPSGARTNNRVACCSFTGQFGTAVKHIAAFAETGVLVEDCVGTGMTHRALWFNSVAGTDGTVRNTRFTAAATNAQALFYVCNYAGRVADCVATHAGGAGRGFHFDSGTLAVDGCQAVNVGFPSPSHGFFFTTATALYAVVSNVYAVGWNNAIWIENTGICDVVLSGAHLRGNVNGVYLRDNARLTATNIYVDGAGDGDGRALDFGDGGGTCRFDVSNVYVHDVQGGAVDAGTAVLVQGGQGCMSNIRVETCGRAIVSTIFKVSGSAVVSVTGAHISDVTGLDNTIAYLVTDSAKIVLENCVAVFSGLDGRIGFKHDDASNLCEYKNCSVDFPSAPADAIGFYVVSDAAGSGPLLTSCYVSDFNTVGAQPYLFTTVAGALRPDAAQVHGKTISINVRNAGVAFFSASALTVLPPCNDAVSIRDVMIAVNELTGTATKTAEVDLYWRAATGAGGAGVDTHIGKWVFTRSALVPTDFLVQRGVSETLGIFTEAVRRQYVGAATVPGAIVVYVARPGGSDAEVSNDVSVTVDLALWGGP